MHSKSAPYSLIGIIALSVVLFSPALGNFFSADDWFHLRVSHVNSVQEFFNFFSFLPTPQAISFYRPLSTQSFFWLMQTLFGLNSLPYYLVSLSTFAFSVYLVNQVAKALLLPNKLALLATFLYGISVTNFTKLYFLSTFQEILMMNFVCLAFLNFIQTKQGRGLLFYILALLSKETAVVLLPIVIIWNVFKTPTLRYDLRSLFHNTWSLIFTTFIYLILRFYFFQSVTGDSYIWNFSPFKALNTMFWYILWAFGAPELLVDYVGSGLIILPRFFTDFTGWSYLTLGLLATTLFTFLLIVWNTWHLAIKNKVFWFSSLWFLVSLFPVIFLPLHKFTLVLTLPMVGFVMALSFLILNSTSLLRSLFLLSFILLNISMNYLTYTRHYSVNRAHISRQIYQFLQKKYPVYPPNSYFEFINDTADYGTDWGSSKQIANITSRSDLFRVFYNNPTLIVYFQDFPEDLRPVDKNQIPLSTQQFVR